MTNERTPAQLYALLFGAVLLLVGLVGFAVDSSFDTGSNVNGDDLIAFEVSGWHNLVHIASGLAGLALARTAAGARMFALGFGAIYLVVTLWGFADGETVLWTVPVNTPDNFLHLALGTLGIAAGLSSASRDRVGSPVTA